MRSAVLEEPSFPKAFFLRPVPEVARDLLGALLISEVDTVVSGTVVETEAYGGPEDPASHAAVHAGITSRNASMFGPPGRVYVYRSYGLHWCLNVVTGGVGEPGAVLIRGIEPVSGAETMAERRRGRAPLAAGPGRLTQALGVTGELDGHDLSRPPLRLIPGMDVDERSVGRSGRIGLSRATDRQYRFYLRGSTGVTP